MAKFQYARELEEYEAEMDYAEWLAALRIQRQMEDYFRDRDLFDLTDGGNFGIMEA